MYSSFDICAAVCNLGYKLLVSGISALAREQIDKSGYQSILVVLTHSCYHIKRTNKVFLTLFTALARTLW